MYSYDIKPNLRKILNKLSKKDKNLYKQVFKKIEEIINDSDIEHYKNLRRDLKEFKRVHIRHFVLVFKFEKSKGFISFEDFNHHDFIYKNLNL